MADQRLKTMDTTSGEDPPPKSTDLSAWRHAVEVGRFREFRLEAVVAAIQDLVPHTDKAVLHMLAKHLSDSMLRMLRAFVGFNHPNQGQDIIDRVHFQLWEALLQPQSADGRGLRIAFGARVKYRLKDAIAVEARSFRTLEDNQVTHCEKDENADDPEDPTEVTVETLSEHRGRPDLHDSDEEITPSRGVHRSPARSLLDGVRNTDEERNVASVLQLITDDRKRLAFRLYMDGVPFKSKRCHSIAAALDISEKTARQWIKEVQEFLKSKMGDNT
jgi:hypothetical protein